MIAVERLIDIAIGQRVGVKHQVLADQPRRIGDTVGKFRRHRIQHQPRRADAVAGEDDDFGGLKLLLALGVVIDHAGSHAVFVDRDFTHPAARAQLDAGADRERPIGDVGRGFGALRATRRAVAEIDAARAPFIIGGGDGGVGRPPVPAELVHRLAEAGAGLAERQWRHRRLLRRISGIAGEPGNAHHAVVLGEVWFQRGIVDRPVVGDAVQRAHLEVGRVHARKVRRVHDGAAADTVEVHHLDRRIGVVDRVVGRPGAAVGIDGEIAEQPRLPVPAVAGIIGRLHPVALLEAENPHPGVGKAPRHRRARCSGPDNQHIDLIVHRTSP